MSLQHYSLRTEEFYTHWIERYIRFHGIRHPNTMGTEEVEQSLTSLAVDGNVAASTQNQALAALLFFYQKVLKIEIGRLDAMRAQRPVRLPTVLSVDEVRALLNALDLIPTTESHALVARLMYGAGLRLLECCRLRMKDFDMDRGQITVREGKGDKDRYVMLANAKREAIWQRMEWRTALHAADLAHGLGWVHLPTALDRKSCWATTMCGQP